MTTSVEVYRDEKGQWRWRAKAGNGEIIATGEAHTLRWSAKRAARRVFPDAELDLNPRSSK